MSAFGGEADMTEHPGMSPNDLGRVETPCGKADLNGLGGISIQGLIKP
jgi:hypothetical protein